MNLDEDLLKKVVGDGRVRDPARDKAMKLAVVLLPDSFDVGHKLFDISLRVDRISLPVWFL
jgi:hypothetical protein